ncbi:MAG: hypothetical protein HRT36_08350 [Alphaproteobacteria bacterium]|nr:hypothetical protein [Alphaproteobacteria bacterium]
MSEDRRQRTAYLPDIRTHEHNKRPIIYIDESSFAHDTPRTLSYICSRPVRI